MRQRKNRLAAKLKSGLVRLPVQEALASHASDRRLHLGRGRKLAEIVQDAKYPTMWRVRKPDGSLSDMLNRTRAKDAAQGMALSILNSEERRATAAAMR